MLLRALSLTLCLACHAEEPVPPKLDPNPSQSRGLQIAGQAEASPLMRRLLGVFQAQQPGALIRLLAPISPRGAQQALRDGRLDGVLLMDSRKGLLFAQSRALLMVGPGVGTSELSLKDLLGLFNGEQSFWPGGLPRSLLWRAERAAAQAALRRQYELPGPREGRGLQGDAELRENLRISPGLVGATDSGSLALHGAPLWRLRLPKPAPKLEIRLLLSDDPPARLKALTRFLKSREAQAQIEELGYELP